MAETFIITSWLFKHAIGAYNSNQLANDIELLHSRISDVYSDISTAHFKSAIDAISSVQDSKSSEIQIRGAIEHLRDAYYILEQQINKIIRKTSWFFFVTEKYMIDDRESAYNYLAHLAALISIIFGFLHESKNSSKWKNRASQKFLNYVDFISINDDVLYKINKKFVHEVEYTVYNPGRFDGDIGYESTETRTETSPLGYKYIERCKKNAHKEFIKNIDIRLLINS